MNIRISLLTLALILPLSSMAQTESESVSKAQNIQQQAIAATSDTIVKPSSDSASHSEPAYSLIERFDSSALVRNFAVPPKAAKPQVWWHWMDGNVSKEGIRKDIEWMKRNGIGGFHQFDAGGVNMPRAAKTKLPYFSDGWKDAFRFALNLADSLDMDVTIASAPGWSSTGGTWVKPQDAIKKLEWRTMDVRGGKVSVQLPDLYNVVGPYQDYHTENDRIKVNPYGEDLYVLAVRLPSSDKPMNALGSVICSNDSTISVEFRNPQTIKSLTLKSMAIGGRPKEGTVKCTNYLESSDDGLKWRKVCDIEPTVLPYLTMNIPPTCAQYFRVKGEKLESLELYTVSKVNHCQELGGFGIIHDFWKYHTPYSKDAIRTSDIIDLTGKMTTDGKLECSLPAGRWRIYRFGWSITGKINHPASPEATGLEVDKLDPDAWMRYFRTYLDLYKEASGGMLGQKGIRYLLVDSYEAGTYTWTPKLAEEFKARRGYDLTPWLPVLAGEIIGSSQMSERFLWDWRKTLGELFCENYDRINDIVKEYDLAGRYTESHETNRAFTGDGMDPKIKATIPMAAFWMENTPTGSSVPSAVCDIRESASVSHIYGKPLVAAESFTVDGDQGRAYTYCPESMKYVADVALSAGVNRFVIHESASQPNDEYLPGLQLFHYGQWLHRNETWGEYAWVLTDYLARSSSMLQQGKSNADILLYYGEDLNISGLYGGKTFNSLPQVPDGYEYDFANPTVIKTGIKAENGMLVAPSGAYYKILWMDRNCEVMSLEILRKIKEFADAGVIICGNEPQKCAGMKADDRAFASIVEDVWHSGRKNVYTDGLEDCLKRSGIRPDFIASSSSAECGGGFRYVHRTLNDSTQIYWVRNFSGKDSDVELSFRDGGNFAAIFNSDNGEITGATVQQDGDRSKVKLRMLSTDARFVVLSGKPQITMTVDTLLYCGTDSAIVRKADSPENAVHPENCHEGLSSISGFTEETGQMHETETILTVDTPWTVHFAQKNGGTADEKFPELVSWTEKEDPVVKYFSGTAVYNVTVSIDSVQLADNTRIFLDLGSVKNIADVTINGTPAGVLWKAPFRTTDIKKILNAGENTLEIKVTNVWRNRMIGDVQPDEKHPVTSIRRFYKADDELIPSGLLGPVVIMGEK
jgi:hypothetical protein